MQVRQKLGVLKRAFWSKRMAIILMVLAAVFALINICLFFSFKNCTYPNTFVGNVRIGNKTTNKVTSGVTENSVLPNKINLTLDEKQLAVEPSTLGVNLDTQQIMNQAKKQRSWLPVVSYFKTYRVPVYISIDNATFSQYFNTIKQAFEQDVADAKIINQDGIFSITKERTGHKLVEHAVKQAIVDQLAKNPTSVQLPSEKTIPKVTKANLEPQVLALQKQQKISITFVYASKTASPTPQDIGKWYNEQEKTFVLNDDRIKYYITSVGSGFGIRIKNLNEASNAAKDALKNNKPLKFTLIAAPTALKSYTYCVATRGVDNSYLPGLSAKLVGVYNDARGWGLDGLVQLSPVNSGCTFTVWLSAASQMPTFGSICDAEWSCSVGPNVVINFDRWQGASAAWNASGGKLDDYRTMVINHETGHWFGFGHKNCGGPGQAAPVMQQQSINLQGCTFNPWPLPSELAELKTQLGI